MVTHISPSGSNLSLPLHPAPSSNYRPAYAASQAGSSSASYRGTSSSQYRENPYQRTRAPSTSSTSTSSQRTLIPPTPSAQSVSGYPAAPSCVSAGPSAYRAPSTVSTSAARPSRHSRNSSTHSRSRRSREVEPEVQNTFPWFGQTGDVEICFFDRRKRTEKRYMLHGLILAQNSAWFEVENTRWVKDVSTAGAGHAQSYAPGLRRPSLEQQPSNRQMFELDWSRFVDDQERIPVLARSQSNNPFASRSPRPPTVSTHNKPPTPSTSFFRNLTSSTHANPAPPQLAPSDDQDILTAYDNLFLAFYNHTPRLSTTNIATAYVDSKLLLSLASFYSAIDTVGPRVDHHLLRFGSRLWKQVAKYPPSYLKLGHLAKSRAIFSEALVHVVGTWPLAQPQLKRGAQGVDDVVVNLIEDKVDEVEDTKLRIEAKLFRLGLTTGRGERVGPANAYVDWLALSLFRQWVADSTAASPSGILKDSARGIPTNARPQSRTPPKLVRTYFSMAAGGQAYLSHDECKRFLKLRPAEYSRENLRRFERRMDELKNLARDVVRPLTRHCLELDASHELDYVTSARCEERDFAYIWEGT